MKTRIISAIIGLALFIAVMALSGVFPPILCIVFGLLIAMGNYEILNNTGFVKSKRFLIPSLIYGFIVPFVFPTYLLYLALTAIFVAINIFVAVFSYGKYELKNLCANLIFPIMLGFAFSSVYVLAMLEDTKLLYFVLIFIFAWGADTGAYFAGTFFGKHKLCPNISPKKTVEGAIGGIISSVFLAALVGCIYANFLNIEFKWLVIILGAVIFSVVGMIGDLFASVIKRQCGIKDYGNIMPGHGGVLDRFDSVLTIAPYFLFFVELFNVI